MKVRYTASGARDLEKSIDDFLQRAPHVVRDFADEIDDAVARLRKYPYSAQESEERGVYRKYIRRFQYSIFYSVDEAAAEIGFCTFATLHAGGRGKTNESDCR